LETGTDFTRVFDLLPYQAKRFPQSRAALAFHDGVWRPFSTGQLQQLADAVSSWLINTGVNHGDRVAVVPKLGSPQWLAVDFGCQQIGAIVVPLHPTANTTDMEFILQETAACCCITADETLVEKVKYTHVDTVPFVHHLGSFEPLHSAVAVHESLPDRKARVTPDDVAAIMYTSGTSGTPKGAVLTHGNIVASIKSVLTLLPLEPGDRVLSFLPCSHIFERVVCYSYLALGVSVYFSASLEGLAGDFRSVRPLFCTAVPRTLEKMFDYLEELRESSSFFKRWIIGWAMNLASKYKDKAGIGYQFQLTLARWLILYRWRRSLGGKIKYMIVGAAALRPEIARLFSAAGILTLSGYGMTEASPFISTNRTQPGLNKFGTVGIPVPGVDVRIDAQGEDGSGEILVRGPNIMSGYYKRPELTAEVKTPDGWLRTGDVGKMIEYRFLAITDRKKDIFKTSTGKYVAPQAVQNQLNSSPFIAQSLIIGFNRPFVTAIIVPHFQLLMSWCEQHSIHWTSPPYMVHNIKVVQKYQEEIDRINRFLESHERVKGFILSEEEWTVEGRELTTSFKPVRSNLMEKHLVQIEKLYEA